MTSRLVLPFADVGSGITPSDGAKLTFKNPGLETLKDTFSDAAGTIANTNPVIADATGLFSNIYINGNYDVVLQDKNNVQIWADSVSEFATKADTTIVKNFATLALAVADTGLVKDDAINIAEREADFGGGGMVDVVLSTSVTENSFYIIQCTGVPTLSLVFRVGVNALTGDYWMAKANTRMFGARGDGIADDTTAVQAFIDFVGNGAGTFGRGRYLVDSVTFGSNGATFDFENATIKGAASVATDAVVELTGAFMQFNGKFSIDVSLNTNYDAGLKWHSLSTGAPAQFNQIDTLSIGNAKIALLYGQLSGDTVIDAPQSENFIGKFITTATEIAIYYNQSNAYLGIQGGAFGALIGGWGGGFDFSAARVVKQFQGTLALNGCECIATENTSSKGFEVTGGNLSVNGGIWEIAGTNIELSNCNFVSTGVTSAFFNSTTLPFVELLTGTSGTLKISDFRLEKASGSDTANQGFLEVNTTPLWDVDLSNIHAFRQQRTSIIKSTFQNNTYVTNINFDGFHVRGNAEDVDIKNSSNNILEYVPTSASAIDNLWFQNGTGTTTLDAVEKPTVNGRTYAHSIKLDASASAASVTNLDRTNVASIKATGARVIPGKKYIIEGWIKRETSGTGNVKFFALTYDTTAVTPSSVDISTEAEFVGEVWTYIRGIVAMNSSAAFLGIGISVTNDIGYFIDLKVARTD